MNLPLALVQLWMLAVFFMGISYLWKSNPFFTFTMQMVIGVMAANHFLLSVETLQGSWWNFVLKGNMVYAMMGIVAVLLFATFLSSKWSWLARYPTAILAGTGIGMELRNIMQTDVIGQIQTSMLPLVANDLIKSFSNIVFVVTLVLSLFYFMFGFEMKGAWSKVNKAARLLIMLAMGADAGLYSFWSQSMFLMMDQFLMVKFYVTDFLKYIAP